MQISKLFIDTKIEEVSQAQYHCFLDTLLKESIYILSVDISILKYGKHCVQAILRVTFSAVAII